MQDNVKARHEQIVVQGLSAPAEILVDRWGIAHLRASSNEDGFFLQGFNAARDRLWQIDLWRKRGLGVLARDFGPGYLAQDRACRAFLYRGDMRNEWLSYAPDAQEIVTAFVAGINAYIDYLATRPEKTPPEFGIVGTQPSKWRPEDVVRIRSHGLTRNALSEVLRANVTAIFDDETDLLRKNLEPRVKPSNAGGIDLKTVPIDVLNVFRLATAPVSFSADRLSASLSEAARWTRINELEQVVREATWQGSNNWAIAAEKSTTGRPVMAGDPHRNHSMPGLRYLVHLTTPEFDVIGAGEPSVPGISMGHNGTMAFTTTIFGSDQEDVYVYETHPDDPNQYRHGDSWRPMERVHEVFDVKGYPPQTVELKYTCHGPVLFSDPGSNRAFALRSIWFEPGSGAYLAGLSAMRAKNLNEFRSALRRWNAPALNHVYADVSGTIAWQPFGMTPIRSNWDGLLPIPGDGRFEWSGFMGLEDMPNDINPARGFIATANEWNVPDYQASGSTPIGYEWLEKSRAARITEVLDRPGKRSFAESISLQTDVTSIPARRLKSLLSGLSKPINGSLATALAVIAEWDCRLDASSAAAALVEYWWTRHLKPAVFALFAPEERQRAYLAPGDIEGILLAIERPSSKFGDRPLVRRDDILATTLQDAFAELAEILGDNVATWEWGKLHHGYFEHPLDNLPVEKPALSVGPLPKGGSASTVMHAAYRANDFRVTMGASVRFILDVGNWDASVCINAPGQSGDCRSPHYSDLASKWAAGQYVPFLYSQAAVDAAATVRIRLAPARLNQKRAGASS